MQIALYLEFMLLCIFILTLILIHAVQGVSRGKGWRLFISTIVCALGCQILDLFWGLIDMEALTVPVSIHFIISALYFVATETLSFCWFFYSEYTQDSSLVKTERNMTLCSIPYFLSIALLVVTCRNGCIFYIDSSNVYHRGSFYGLYELLAYGYILFTSTAVKISFRQKYGHVEGDNALLRIAEILKLLCVQKDYFVSRYGGDEFIMVCEAESRTEIDMLCHKIEEALEKLNQTYSTPYSLSLSIGCAHYTEDIQSIPDFIARADETLYKVKKKRHGRLH